MTTNAHHTPGPWNVVDDHPDKACYYIIGHNPWDDWPDFSVATVYRYGSKYDHELSAKMHAAHTANAKLIAAAPDLLAALQRLRDEVQDAHVGSDERCRDCPVCQSLMLADAAIKLAGVD